MHTRLERLYQKLENSRIQLLSTIEKHPKNLFTQKPTPEEWSMAQVVVHLAMTENQILGYVRKKYQKGALADSNFRSWLRYIIVVLALRFRKKIKAPKQVIGPPEQITIEQARQEWDTVRMQWKQFLSLLPAHTLRKNIFKHPLVGFINIFQTLDFMNEHVLHHIPQIKRIGTTVAHRKP